MLSAKQNLKKSENKIIIPNRNLMSGGSNRTQIK
jgi:hypothetical protein